MKRILLFLLLFPVLTYAQCFRNISPGFWHTAGVMDNNTMWTWGGDNFEALGNMDHVGPTNTPIPVHNGLPEWQIVVGGYTSNLAIKTDGSLYGWGGNVNGLWYPTTGEPYESYPIPTLIDDGVWSSASISNFSSGIKEDGTLWAWGNQNPVTANGNTVYVPTQIGSDTDWMTVISGAGTIYALKTDGTLWRADQDNPAISQIGNDTWLTITVDFGIKSDGSLWNIHPTNGLIQFAEGNDWVFVKKRFFTGHQFAIKNDGTLWAWGSNHLAQFGNGNTDDYPDDQLVQVGTDTDWVWAAPGGYFSFGKKVDGSYWAWGTNGSGELGLGDNSSRTTPALFTCNALSTDEQSVENQVRLFPNPAKEMIQVDIPNGFQLNRLQVYDIRGNIILDEKNQTSTINVSSLSSGVYILKLNFGNIFINKKFVKE